MPKEGEIGLPDALGHEGRRHAALKPFSDPACGRYLRDFGTVLQLLPPPPARLLDLGAGTGWTSAFLALHGYDVTAQDIAPGMIELAKQNRARYQAGSLAFVVQDYEHMDFDGEFDCAVFFDSLHHAEDEQAALRSVHRALKPGGVCITAEPGKGHGEAQSSREFVDHFRVTEKDMPPARIIAAGRAAGFARFEVFERTREPKLLFAGIDEHLRRPTRLALGMRYLANGVRCLIGGVKQRDAPALGFAPGTTLVRENFVRLHK